MQRTRQSQALLHLGVIMDGNGRWAARRGLPRSAGHRRGAQAVRRTVEAALELGIGVLTLYAFSSDNWRRPTREVDGLMRLLETFLDRERDGLRKGGVRLNVIGRRDRLPRAVVEAVERAEWATRGGRTLLLRLAVDYSARGGIAAAALLPRRADLEPLADFERRLEIATHSVPNVPPPDLVIRTGGERRLSDFLLWETAYAELLFLPAAWPDFDRADLAAALDEFHRRTRRFGGLPAAAS